MIDVLLIDDEPQILELTKFFLEREGNFEVETTLSGRTALDMMVHRTYDAVVSDYQMPELDGLELLKILRAQRNDIPFILFTGRGREDVAIDALNNGADYYIQKGGDPKSQFAELAHMIGQSVQQRRAEMELRKSEERYKLIFETTGTAMVVVDEDGTMMLVNTEFEELLSYSREELEGKMRYNDLIAKEDLARVTGYFRARLVDPKAPPRQYELILTDKHGVAKSVLATVAMIPGTKARLASIIDLSGLKRTEEELRKSETRYKALFENAGDSIHILDFEGKILEANQISSDRLGYAHEEFLQKTIMDITNAENASLIPARLKKLRENGRAFFRSANVRRDGTVIQVEANSRVIDFEGSPAILTVSRDITQRIEAEEDLRSTRAYLENLLDYANAPVIVWDASGKITRFNHAFERLTGYAAKEVIGRELEILFPANTKEISLDDRIRKTLTGEFWESVEIQILRNDGSIRTALWNSANVYAEDGKTLVATIAQGQDITERKQAEEKLRETRDYLENLIDYANAPIIVWDSAFKIARFNNAFERLTGYEAGDVVGKELQVLFPEESRKESFRRIEETLAGEHWESVEIPIRRKDGATRLVLWNSANVHAGNGSRLVGTIAQGQDITERKRYEDACKQANKKLRLLGGITRHDLLNQVGILKGWLEIARGSKEDASTKAYLDSAMEAADVIQAHLEFASDYEKIGMARKKWLSVEEVFRAGARGLDLSRISLILDLDGLEVFADSMLEKVFRNLIDNSWRHGVRVTKIHVHHEETEDGLRLIVEDDGAGVPKDEKDLIFERRIGKNKGHGLFLVKEILAIAGMAIKETGEAERGARFEILIPKRTYRFRLLR